MSNETKQDGDLPVGIGRLRSIIRRTPPRLALISEENAGRRPSPKQWSIKEELGHLIDSAANNHRRIIVVQLEDSPALPGYDGDGWASLNSYATRAWAELVDLWRAFNVQLLAAAEAAPASAWSRTCTIGGSDSLTLRFVIDDYVDHMMGHLRHIGLEASDLEVDGAELEYPEKPAPAAVPINSLIDRRWSPRLFAKERRVEKEAILILLESARWAPSCFNEQPARYIVFDGSDSEALDRARNCLVEGNAWAREAPLLMLSVARDNFTFNESPNRHAQHDVGLASENLVLAAVDLGLAAHQMAGFDLERSRTEFKIPSGFTPMAMIAIGYPYHGDLASLDEKTRTRELAPRSRKSIGEIAFEGTWDKAYEG